MIIVLLILYLNLFTISYFLREKDEIKKWLDVVVIAYASRKDFFGGSLIRNK
jgi:hypothetical protein